MTGVQVTCNVSTFEIGGAVTGLTGSGLVLQDNGGDNLAITGGGSFTFATAVAYGGGYNVTVSTQPAGQTCVVTNGSGIVAQAVSNVSVVCTNVPTYTVTPSADANGVISPNTPQTVNSGGSITFTAIPSVIADVLFGLGASPNQTRAPRRHPRATVDRPGSPRNGFLILT